MSTRPKNPREMERPNRRFGDVLRAVLSCPLCRYTRDGKIGEPELRVVAYRRNTVRIECPKCGLRFSVGQDDVVRRISEGGPLNFLALVIHNRHERE